MVLNLEQLAEQAKEQKTTNALYNNNQQYNIQSMINYQNKTTDYDCDSCDMGCDDSDPGCDGCDADW